MLSWQVVEDQSENSLTLIFERSGSEGEATIKVSCPLELSAARFFSQVLEL